MLSQNQIKQITALKVKKYRDEFGLFVAEGHKLVMELINSPFKVTGIYASVPWMLANLPLIGEKKIPIIETLPREMERISFLSTPSPVLAVIEIPEEHIPESNRAPIRLPVPDDLCIALDDIRDPGNLGTIIRVADWFGITTVFCSTTSVDLFNPKVVQATMGSIARVNVAYADLRRLMVELSGEIPVYGTCTDGENLYGQTLTPGGIILVGSESRGITTELLPFVSKKITIPSFEPPVTGKAESLNASIATAIVCAEFRRQSSMRMGKISV